MTPVARARDAEARRARAERILDAAAELLQRWGYKRFTMDDIADHAGIGKGTIYLHWTTREALFMAVIAREFGRGMDGLLTEIAAKPEAALLHNLMRGYYQAFMGRPLLRAAIVSDPDVLGRLKQGVGQLINTRMRCALDEYLRLHVEQGLLRDSVSVEELCYAARATMRGFFLADATGMEDYDLSVERKAALLGETLRRAFEVPESIPDDVLKLISDRALEIFSEIASYFRAQLAQAYE